MFRVHQYLPMVSRNAGRPRIGRQRCSDENLRSFRWSFKQPLSEELVKSPRLSRTPCLSCLRRHSELITQHNLFFLRTTHFRPGSTRRGSHTRDPHCRISPVTQRRLAVAARGVAELSRQVRPLHRPNKLHYFGTAGTTTLLIACKLPPPG